MYVGALLLGGGRQRGGRLLRKTVLLLHSLYPNTVTGAAMQADGRGGIIINVGSRCVCVCVCVKHRVHCSAWRLASTNPSPCAHRHVPSSATNGGRREQGAYAASKAGIQCLTETLALEGKAHGISAFCVVPRRTATELRSKLYPDEVRGRWTALGLGCAHGAVQGERRR